MYSINKTNHHHGSEKEQIIEKEKDNGQFRRRLLPPNCGGTFSVVDLIVLL
jgi:hypothetical protein